jgi:hypothetical protein
MHQNPKLPLRYTATSDLCSTPTHPCKFVVHVCNAPGKRCSTPLQSCTGPLHCCNVTMYPCRASSHSFNARLQRCNVMLHSFNAPLHGCNAPVQWCNAPLHLCEAPLKWCSAPLQGCTASLHRCRAPVQRCNGSLHPCSASLHQFRASRHPSRIASIPCIASHLRRDQTGEACAGPGLWCSEGLTCHVAASLHHLLARHLRIECAQTGRLLAKRSRQTPSEPYCRSNSSVFSGSTSNWQVITNMVQDLGEGSLTAPVGAHGSHATMRARAECRSQPCSR